MLEEFHKNVYLDIFYQYVLLNKEIYQQDSITCHVIEDNNTQKVIYFDVKDVYGKVTFWTNAIIEEEIFRKDNNDLLFYLHYKIISIAQCKELFQEFYKSLKQQSIAPPTKVLLCCSGGLTTTLFATRLQDLIHLEKLNFEVDAIGFHQLKHYYNDYDILYLAPQIAYLQPEAIDVTKQNIPVHCIDPTTFATRNYKHLLDCLVQEVNE